MVFGIATHGYRVVDSPAGDKPLTFDIELDPGESVTGSVIGPDRRPVKGATAFGLTLGPNQNQFPPQWTIGKDQKLDTESFTATTIDPDTGRTLTFVDLKRRLIGHVVVRGTEKPMFQVRLKKWGAVTGRVVDKDGRPLTGIELVLQYPKLPAPGIRPWKEVAKTDADGRFRVEGLIPSLKHNLALSRIEGEKRTALTAGDAVKNLVLTAGEVEDLGDVTLSTASP